MEDEQSAILGILLYFVGQDGNSSAGE